MNYTTINTSSDNFATSSPFVYRENEYITKFDKSRGYVELNDEDLLIFKLLNKYLVLTNKLLYSALIASGLSDTSYEEMQYRVKALAATRYITKLEFTVEGSHKYTHAYILGYRGRGLLKAKGIRPHMWGYVDNLNSIQLKKILAANQYLLCTKVSVADCNIGLSVMVPPRRDERTQLIFRPQAIIQDESCTIFVETVRKDDCNYVQLVEKLKRADKTLRSFRDKNIAVVSPVMVIVAESEEHMKSIISALSHKSYIFELKFTYDIKVFTSPENCICAVIPPQTKFFWQSFVRKISAACL